MYMPHKKWVISVKVLWLTPYLSQKDYLRLVQELNSHRSDETLLIVPQETLKNILEPYMTSSKTLTYVRPATGGILTKTRVPTTGSARIARCAKKVRSTGKE